MNGRVIATVDLGSNSFHLLIAKVWGPHNIKVLCKKKKKVQLRVGVDLKGDIDPVVAKRALSCLAEFGSHIKRYHVEAVKAVGTYSLRQIKQDHAFLQEANDALGHPIEIITGLKEAQLIYRGIQLAHDVKDTTLCIDIGGGSTEITLANEHETYFANSLEMGCVSIQQMFFKDERITEANFKAAMDHATSIIEPYQHALCNLTPTWHQVFGSSGTVQAIYNIIEAAKLDSQGGTQERAGSDVHANLNIDPNTLITGAKMQWIYLQLLKMQTLEQVHFKGLRKDRENILPGGLAILMALFKTLDIEQMQLSYSALREGLLSECMT